MPLRPRTKPPVAAISGSSKGAVRWRSQDGSATASSSMKATISPAAATMPALRAAEMLAASKGMHLMRAASSRAPTAAAPRGQVTAITSRRG